MSQLAIVGIAFALTLLAELPDKTMFASLVLATRYRPLWVWIGAAAAFSVHVAIAVTAGHLFSLLPHRVVDGIVAGLFTAGAVYLWVSSFRPDSAEHHGEEEAARMGGASAGFWRVAGSAFGVIFLAEWGDITQISTANLAARYSALPVAIGAALGLWTAAAIGITIGSKSLRLIPIAWVSRVAGLILLALGVYSAISAIRG